MMKGKEESCCVLWNDAAKVGNWILDSNRISDISIPPECRTGAREEGFASFPLEGQFLLCPFPDCGITQIAIHQNITLYHQQSHRIHLRRTVIVFATSRKRLHHEHVIVLAEDAKAAWIEGHYSGSTRHEQHINTLLGPSQL